jgi:hypothetical protein
MAADAQFRGKFERWRRTISALFSRETDTGRAASKRESQTGFAASQIMT